MKYLITIMLLFSAISYADNETKNIENSYNKYQDKLFQEKLENKTLTLEDIYKRFPPKEAQKFIDRNELYDLMEQKKGNKE